MHIRVLIKHAYAKVGDEQLLGNILYYRTSR